MLTAINVIAMSAAYSPNPKSSTYGIDLPFDLETGELRETIWKKWIKYDPVHLVSELKYQLKLRKLRGVFLECGSRDEYHLHIGARIFVKKLKNTIFRSGMRNLMTAIWERIIVTTYH